MAKSKRVVVSFSMSPKTFRELKSCATWQGMSRSAFVEHVLKLNMIGYRKPKRKGQHG